MGGWIGGGCCCYKGMSGAYDDALIARGRERESERGEENEHTYDTISARTSISNTWRKRDIG